MNVYNESNYLSSTRDRLIEIASLINQSGISKHVLTLVKSATNR